MCAVCDLEADIADAIAPHMQGDPREAVSNAFDALMNITARLIASTRDVEGMTRAFEADLRDRVAHASSEQRRGMH